MPNIEATGRLFCPQFEFAIDIHTHTNMTHIFDISDGTTTPPLSLSVDRHGTDT